MTIKKHLPLIGLLVFFALLTVLLLMPLGFAAQSLGVSARNSQDTLMSGALRNASLGRIRIARSGRLN